MRYYPMKFNDRLQFKGALPQTILVGFVGGGPENWSISTVLRLLPNQPLFKTFIRKRSGCTH